MFYIPYVKNDNYYTFLHWFKKYWVEKGEDTCSEENKTNTVHRQHHKSPVNRFKVKH